MEIKTDLVTLLINAEELYDEKLNELADEEEIDLGEVDEDDIEGIRAQAFYSIVEDYCFGTVVDLFNTRVVDKSQIENIFIKVNGAFYTLEKIDDISLDDWLTLDNWKIPLYFVLKEETPLFESYFLKLSEGISSFTVLLEIDGKVIYQGYDEGDYNTGYFSNGQEECYVKNDNDWTYANEFANRNDIIK